MYDFALRFNTTVEEMEDVATHVELSLAEINVPSVINVP